MKTGYDASSPPAHPPAADVVAFYGGGDTPHVWTLAQIDAQPARYRLPIFVRSNPAGHDGLTDARVFIAYLRSIGCPTWVVTVLDLETAVNTAYVNTFGAAMHAASYLVLPYGSSSTLRSNPVLDGYWMAKPGATGIPLGCVGVQYMEDAGGGAYDLDLFADSLVFWDTQPVPAPPPPDPEDNVNVTAYNVDVEIVNGNGWIASPAFVGKLCGVFVEGSTPDSVSGKPGSYNTSVPHFVSIASAVGDYSPNGAIEMAGPADGMFGVLLQFYS